ncbi:MAG: N-6 DNA methylase, partial [Ginsengibacter sp.]
LCWSVFKDLDGAALHNLFTTEKGIPDLINNYGRTNLQFSKFVREPLLLRPTARLLTNVVDIIKIMDEEGGAKRALIFEHLIGKVEIEAQNGQVYAPGNVVKLMVELMQPTSADLIWDPCAGNANFLINCATYIKLKNSSAINNFNENFYAGICTGIETDPIQLRIGAMNMIIHSINNPKLDSQNILNEVATIEPGQASLIMSNLFFDDASAKTQIVANKSQGVNDRKEIQFLHLIVKHLKKGGRAAVLVPEYILYNNAPDIKTIRQLIIDEHKLEAIITLPHSAGKIFSGACILIIDDSTSGTTDDVWLYKMNASINKTLPDDTTLKENNVWESFDDYNNINDLLTEFKNKKQEADRSRTENSFYVTAEEIKDNNYNLCFNEYRKVASPKHINTTAEVPGISTKKNLTLLTIKPKFNIDLLKRKFNLSRIKIDAPGIKFDILKTKLDLRRIKLDLPRIKPDFLRTKFHLRRIKLDLQKIKFDPVKIKLGQRLQLLIKKTPTFVAASIFIFIAAIASYFIFFRNKNSWPANISLKNELPRKGAITEIKAAPIVIVNDPAPSLSQEQIKAILYDTAGINHFNAQPNNELPVQADSAHELNNDNDQTSQNDFESTADAGVQSYENNLQVKYKVVDTTFFHDEPIVGSSRKTFLDPLKNNVLNSLQDKNGFIYIVYTNALGRTSKGWISKKDLKPLR